MAALLVMLAHFSSHSVDHALNLFVRVNIGGKTFAGQPDIYRAGMQLLLTWS